MNQFTVLYAIGGVSAINLICAVVLIAGLKALSTRASELESKFTSLRSASEASTDNITKSIAASKSDEKQRIESLIGSLAGKVETASSQLDPLLHHADLALRGGIQAHLIHLDSIVEQHNDKLSAQYEEFGATVKLAEETTARLLSLISLLPQPLDGDALQRDINQVALAAQRMQSAMQSVRRGPSPSGEPDNQSTLETDKAVVPSPRLSPLFSTPKPRAPE